MSASRRFREYEVTFTVKVGSRATLELTILDADGNAKDLSDTATYSTAKWKVWKPDGTLIIDGSASFSDRANGKVSYNLSATDTAAINAGSWEGEVELFNNSAIITEQSETFGFDIEESF